MVDPEETMNLDQIPMSTELREKIIKFSELAKSDLGPDPVPMYEQLMALQSEIFAAIGELVRAGSINLYQQQYLYSQLNFEQ